MILARLEQPFFFIYSQDVHLCGFTKCTDVALWSPNPNSVRRSGSVRHGGLPSNTLCDQFIKPPKGFEGIVRYTSVVCYLYGDQRRFRKREEKKWICYNIVNIKSTWMEFILVLDKIAIPFFFIIHRRCDIRVSVNSSTIWIELLNFNLVWVYNCTYIMRREKYTRLSEHDIEGCDLYVLHIEIFF